MIVSWTLILARSTCWRPRKSGWQEIPPDIAFKTWTPSSTGRWQRYAKAGRPRRPMSAPWFTTVKPRPGYVIADVDSLLASVQRELADLAW
jgi:hypothetical protein